MSLITSHHEGMMPRPPSDMPQAPQNGDKANGPETPVMDRPPSTDRPHPYSPHPQMNGYAGMNPMMDYSGYSQGHQGYGYKPPYPYYPYPHQQGVWYTCTYT